MARLWLLPALIVLASCGEDAITAVVSGRHFCVPAHSAVRSSFWSSWWIPQNLPDNGFRFQVVLARSDRAAQPTQIKGVVEEAGRYIGMRQPAPGSRYWTVLTARDTKHRPVLNGKYLVSHSQDYGSTHFVWKMRPSQEGSEPDFAKSGELMAVCSEPHLTGKVRDEHNISLWCSRALPLPDIDINYSFDGSLLADLDRIDKGILEQVTAWRCDKAKS
jgi:hypothetical protein